MKKKTTKLPTIYIQIAAYRDPELLPTLKDCLANATHPERLSFGIAWQHSPYEEWDNLDEFKHDPRFTIIDIDYRDARGPCWARHRLNTVYKKQTYTLQLDSHHRFIQGWDNELVDMLENLRTHTCPKPLLSSYLPSFNPANDPADRIDTPWIMEFDRFAPEGPVHFLPHSIDDYKERNEPVPSRFISGHFIFADGKFCKEVPYDPEYYFHGEEINLSVRAYMAGYDLFAPHKSIMWHEYTRNNKKKHWDDHLNWDVLNKKSHDKNKFLLGIDSNTIAGVDQQKYKRSLRAYEKYAGIEFKTRQVHTNALQRKFPTQDTSDEEHLSGLTYYHKICIDVYKPTLSESDYNVWAVAFEDEDGNEIYRQDASSEEISNIMSIPFEQDAFVHVWRSFYSKTPPKKWIVWPHSTEKGWMDRLTGDL
jgi:hypothetical protein